MRKGLFFVVLQFCLIAALIWENGWFETMLPELILHLMGIVLGIWSILSMRKSKLNIFPELRQEAKLVSSGPYQRVRHPMYAALLLYFLPFAINSIESALLFFCLMTTLIFKINYEENLLGKTFHNYSAYCLKTHRLIPFIY